jgi:RNA polymerase sigma factor (sigma-70 family)
VDWAEIYNRLRRSRNDSLAWSALEGRVRTLAGRALRRRSPTLVDDVVAETCATVALSLDKARGAETFDGFVLGHLLNARRHVLAFYHAPVNPLGDLDPAAPPDSETDDGLDEARGILERCLRELSIRQRRAVELRYFDEASTASIAVELGVTENNARQIVFRGLARLKQCAEPEWRRERNAQ